VGYGSFIVVEWYNRSVSSELQ